MNDIKVGDRVEIPIVNGTGEVAFIGETHFAKGLWYGVILYDGEGRCDGSVDGIRYFKCAKNRGIFIRSGRTEKKCGDTSDDKSKQHKLPSTITKYLNYLKANFDVEEFYSDASGSTDICKKQPKNETFIVQDKCITNSNERKHMPEKEREDTNKNDVAYVVHSSHSDNKVKYPNYLKANFNENHSYSNASAKRDVCAMQSEKGDYNVLSKNARNNNEIKCALQKTKKQLNKNDASYAPHSSSSDYRIKYPNYLKASSKISWNHICEAKHVDPSKTKYEPKHDDRKICSSKSSKSNCSKCLEMDTIKLEMKELKDKLKMFEEFQQEFHSKFEKIEKDITHLRKEISCGRKQINYKQYHSKHGDCEICSSKTNCIKSLELVSVKTEIEELKNRLKVIEESVQEILWKFEETEKENIHLRKEFSCGRKQINYQEYQSKLLEMGHLNLYKINNCFVDISDGLSRSSTTNYDLESIKAMISRQKAELQEQNEKTLQGLLEIREFLNDNYKLTVRKMAILSHSNRSSLKLKNQGL